MRVLLLGRNGQLGWELERLLAGTMDLVALDRSEADLARADSLLHAVRTVKPDVIVNAAAYNNVDGAEQETELARTVNSVAPGILAEEAKRLGAALIHYSTDYVFDGTKGSPYVESDEPNPLSVYGRTKWEGERAAEQADGANFVFRTSWVYSLRKESFVTKFLGWARKNEQVRVVTDQTSNPTWCRILAETTAQVLAQMEADPAAWTRERRGLYHLAGGGYASRFELARKILAYLPEDLPVQAKEILPAFTSDFNDAARRPAFSALDCAKFIRTFAIAPPAWETSLQTAFADHFSTIPNISI